MRELILASGSPIRRLLFDHAGFTPRVEPAHIDEVLPADTPPVEAAAALSLAKAREVAARFPRAVVVGSDQVMVFRGRSLSKAYSRAGARRRLTELAGREHQFFPAAAVVAPGFEEVVAQHARVRFRPLSAAEIEAYLDTGEWRGCVGSYQIENRGANLVERVDGDLNAVLGMPLFPLLALLRRAGVSPLARAQGPTR